MTVTGLGSSFYLDIPPDTEEEAKIKNDLVLRLQQRVNTMLGGSSVVVELTDTDYTTTFSIALDEFRNRSSKSVYEAHGFLKTKQSVQTYVLHGAIDNVFQVYRRRALFGMGTGFDYFAQVSANLVYPGYGPGGYQGIATYDLAMQYEETLSKLFAKDLQFIFRPENHTITFHYMPSEGETIVLRCYVLKTIAECLSDHWSSQWLFKYTTALCKEVLGRKRAKFVTAPGAQGGAQLDGDKLLQEAKDEKAACEQEILDLVDGGLPAYAIMG